MVDADRELEKAGRAKLRATAHALAQSYAPAAVRYLGKLLKDESASHSDRLKAARELLDRAFGRPAEDHTWRVANDSAPLRVRWMTSADDDR